jgi:hypothetical protein
MNIDLRSTATKKTESENEQKINKYFREPDLNPEDELESPHDMQIEQFSEDTLAHWHGLEFEKSSWEKKWYLIATLILAVIILYALFTNSPIMAITFILIGIVGYLYLQKDPRDLNFSINGSGVIAGNEIYEFSEAQSFWIFYEPHIKAISLRMKGRTVPHIHIPIHDQDPVKLREILMEYLPEKKQELGIVDIIENVLRI